MPRVKKKKNFPPSRPLYMSLARLKNMSMIIHFPSIRTLSQPFNTVSSLFRMYSSIPCGQALLSAGRFFCGIKEELIIIAKNIAMYLKLTNTSGICKQLSWSLEPLITALSQQLNGHIIPIRRLHSLRTLCSNGWRSLCQGSAIVLSLVLSDTMEVPLSDILGKLKTFPQPKVAVFRGMLLIRREFKRAFVK